MDLDFKKYCVLDGTPTTVLLVPRSQSKNGLENETQCLKEDFYEISSSRFSSTSCSDAREMGHIRRCSDGPKRGSVYQSSTQMRLQEKNDRKKIAFSRETASEFLEIVDSLCTTDEVSQRNEMSIPEQTTCTFRENLMDLHSWDSRSIPPSITSDHWSLWGLMRISPEASSRGPSVNRHSSFSAKLALPHSLAHSDGVAPKSSHFTNPLMSEGMDSVGRDFSFSSQNDGINKSGEFFDVDYNHTQERKESHGLSSPTCLHGLFKLEKNRKDGPRFEFSVESPEVSYVARSWKADNALSCVYTFHSVRKANANGWWFKDSHQKRGTVVGRMLVTYSLRTNLKETGAFIDSMVTEFVLYDADHSRSASIKAPVVFDENMNESPGSSRLLKDAETRPELEIAAIVMQAPLKRRECQKLDKQVPCRVEDGCARKIHVVIPAGRHSLPSDGSCGPSSLFDRWRSGGSCGCGGWDMACPLDVYANPSFQILSGNYMLDHLRPALLFSEGRKGIPEAFSMQALEDGKYAVDFHAKLSALQAFSICIALMHPSAETPTAIKSQREAHGDSMRVFAEEEIANLMGSVAEEEEERKPLPSIVPNPPFSPIARV